MRIMFFTMIGTDRLVVEAKRTCVDVAKGRQQAKLYADLLENQYNRRPVVFLTNGFETRIIDNQYPERKVAVIYSKRDLEKLFNLQTMKTSLKHIVVDKCIAGRYYQEGAIKAVCDTFDTRNRRKALLVMATGSGKTRTVIALCKVLLDKGWAKNILFLADRNSLVTQAKRNFARAPRGCDITLLEGDAADILKTLDKPYDLIFMDAAKGQYIHFLPDVLRLLAPDGLLFSDNVLQDGDVLESRFAVTRRNRTIHSRMREYLTMLTHTPELTTSVIPIGDGVSLTMKKNTEEM